VNRTARPKPAHRFIYVIGPAVGLQKVGIATDPRSRLATLQTACPFDLVLHVAIPVPFGEAHAIERRAHRALARSCVRNEWFEATPVEAVAAVKGAIRPQMTDVEVPAEWRIGRSQRGPSRSANVLAKQADGPAQSLKLSPLPLFEFRRAVQASAAGANDRHPVGWALWSQLRRSMSGPR
jgi:hypothetical protein